MERRAKDPRVQRTVRRLVVPVALAVTTIAAASAVVSSTSGCGDDARPDGGAGDAMPDTPIA